jgi:hypothetical protein
VKFAYRVLWAPVLACILASPSPAQDNNELLNRMRAMEERIKALEAEVQSLKGAQTAASPAPPAAAATPEAVAAAPAAPAPQETAAAPQPQLGGVGVAASKALNPDISVIGDFVGGIGNAMNRPTPSLEMHESELGLQEVIDPYARADFFITFGEKGVDLEEGYITFTSLPAGLQLRAGKMRAAFGKVNTLHNHVLPWADRPLVTQNLLSGEEGINDAGLSLSHILPSPKGLFLEGTGQIFRGDSENLFAASRRSQVSTVGHVRAYSDLSESTNLDLGVSYARGHSPFADGWNQLWGADATLRWKPLRRAIYHSFVGRSEFVWSRMATVSGRAKPFGFYVSGDYQLGRRWFLGGRFDQSQRANCLPTSPETVGGCSFLDPEAGSSLLRDRGGSMILTYWPSEFSQIRGQLRRTSYGEGRTANELIFQLMFSMGAHGAHPF